MQSAKCVQRQLVEVLSGDIVVRRRYIRKQISMLIEWDAVGGGGGSSKTDEMLCTPHGALYPCPRSNGLKHLQECCLFHSQSIVCFTLSPSEVSRDCRYRSCTLKRRKMVEHTDRNLLCVSHGESR